MADLVKRPEERQKAMKAYLEKALPSIRDALKGTSLTAERVAKVALMALAANPKLLECAPESILSCIVEASSLGLEIGGATGQAFMVPYAGRATFQLGYKGMIALAHRSGEIGFISARVVRPSDRFEYEYGTSERLIHVPNLAGWKEDWICAYATARMTNGTTKIAVLGRDEILEAHRERSQGWQAFLKGWTKSTPWSTDEASMAAKTMVRVLIPQLPLSIEAHEAFARDEAMDRGYEAADVRSVTINVPQTQESAPPEAEQVVHPEPTEPPPMVQASIRDEDALEVFCQALHECEDRAQVLSMVEGLKNLPESVRARGKVALEKRKLEVK